ncbi:hypothetical protein TNCV_1030131 [Trichonephila clavipes]|nr:hypothetical protein TNCV_1030131 [Trichonephila clavipes]
MALRSNGLFASMFDGLVAFAINRWHHDCGARKDVVLCTARVTNEGRKVRSGYLPFQTRVLYRSCQNDRLQVMLVLVYIDITPPQGFRMLSKVAGTMTKDKTSQYFKGARMPGNVVVLSTKRNRLFICVTVKRYSCHNHIRKLST